MTETPSAAAALEELTGHEAWAVIRLRDSPHRHAGRRVADPVREARRHPARGGRARRGPQVRPAGRRTRSARSPSAGSSPTTTAPRWPSSTIGATEREVPLDELVAALPDEPRRPSRTRAASRPATRTTPRVVERIIRDEIGNGEGANLVIGRHYRAQLADWDPTRRSPSCAGCSTSERGAYWTYCFWTGDRFLIGASPGAARQRARRRRADEPDLRHLPAARRRRRRERKRGCWSSSPTRRRSTSSSWWSTRS